MHLENHATYTNTTCTVTLARTCTFRGMTDYLHGYFSMCESPIGDVQVPIAYSNMPCVNIMSEDTCYLSYQQAKSQQATYI